MLQINLRFARDEPVRSVLDAGAQSVMLRDADQDDEQLRRDLP